MDFCICVLFIVSLLIICPCIYVCFCKFNESFEDSEDAETPETTPKNLGKLIDTLLNKNALLHQKIKSIYNPVSKVLTVNKIKIGNKILDASTINTLNTAWRALDKIRYRLNNIKIEIVESGKQYPAPDGNTDHWDIMVAPIRFGALEPGSDHDNALLKVVASADANASKKHWVINLKFWHRFKAGDPEEKDRQSKNKNKDTEEISLCYIMLLPK